MTHSPLPDKLCFSAAYTANPYTEWVSSILTTVWLLRIFFAPLAEVLILSLKIQFFCTIWPQIVASVVLGLPSVGAFALACR